MSKKFPPKKKSNYVKKAAPKHNWSEYQKNIFRNVYSEKGHCIINAYAGASKTTSIVESLKYIPKGKNALMLAFNKIIQEELSERAPSYVETLTFHSIGLRAIKQRFGNSIELDENKVFDIVKSLLRKSEQNFDLIVNICDTVAYCKYGLLDIPNQIDNIMSLFGIDVCDLPREKFIKIVIDTLSLDKKDTSKIDFNDMCWFPFVYNLSLGQYDYVYVDEAQDLNKAQLVMAQKAVKLGTGRMVIVRDKNQCVDENTVLNTENGNKIIKDIQIGEKIASYDGGKIVYKTILNKVNSNWDYGIKIVTASGKSLIMSPNHKIWAEQQEVNDKFLVYLMYRHDLGFRVGKTNKWKSKSNPFGARAVHERADKLWVLDIFDSNEEAIFAEEYYSLKFGVPTSVFNAEERGINQNRINSIFENFGQNGISILKFKNLHIDYPHWIARSMSASRKSRLVVRISSHGKGKRCSKNTVNFEMSDPNIINLLNSNGITGKKYKRRIQDSEHFLVKKQFSKYTNAFEFANKLSSLTGAYITENLSFGKEDDLRLITASGLFVGMKILSQTNGLIEKDSIISIEKINGKFIDLEIEDTSNFFGNDILSHNSLYSWRMADNSIVDNLETEPTTKILPLPISYRCPKSVIELAKKWVPDITCPDSSPDGEVSDISLNELYKKASAGCFILSRTNAPMIKICMNFIRNGIKANIRGRDVGKQLSFLIKKSKKKQIPAFLKWLSKWKDDEVERLKSKNFNTDNVLDRYECLVNLCDEFDNLNDVVSKIDELFNDNDESNMIILSSVHRAKGLERDNVFILRWTFRCWLDDTLSVVEKPNEEANIAYVAATRSKKKLFIVHKFNQANLDL